MFTTKPLISEENLPWDSFIPNDADKLIIGTFPTKPTLRKYDFFYPNTANPFWSILADLAGHKLSQLSKKPEDIERIRAVHERKAILNELKLGITDMGRRIYRLDNSSSDNKIFPLEFTNIFDILQTHGAIKTLFLTSSSGGNSVAEWFRSYCALNKITFKIPKNAGIKRVDIQVESKVITVIVLPSTSRQSPSKKEILLEQYRNELIK